MSSFKFSFDLLESDKQIADIILKELVQELNSRLTPLYKEATSYIRQTVLDSIKAQPEYISLLSGSLKYEFGLPDSSSRLNAILNTIDQSLFVEYKEPRINGQNINGGFFIGMVNSDFSDILSLGAATLVTEKGSPLEWLKWLLLEGDKMIIGGYDFKIGNFKNSRTGGGIMSPSFSGSWRVPPEFAGTMENNWIIRAIVAIESNIDNYLVSLLQKL